MSQIDARAEAAAIDAVARALVRATTQRDYPHQPTPEWAVAYAKGIMRDIRSRGHCVSPCVPDPNALVNPIYSIRGTG